MSQSRYQLPHVLNLLSRPRKLLPQLLKLELKLHQPQAGDAGSLLGVTWFEPGPNMPKLGLSESIGLVVAQHGSTISILFNSLNGIDMDRWCGWERPPAAIVKHCPASNIS